MDEIIYMLVLIPATLAGSTEGSLLAFVYLLFWIYGVSRGWTLDKLAVGIRMVNSEGRRPGLGRALLRELIGKPIGLIFLALGFLWIPWDPERQSWHDKMAGTKVVVQPR